MVVFSLHTTKKLLDRVKQLAVPPVVEPTTALGNWHGAAVFWRLQVALLVNERTLFPVLMPLAPAATLMARLPNALQQTLEAHGAPADFIEAEVAAMADGRYAKTASRGVIGMMNEFSYLAAVYRGNRALRDLVTLSLRLSETPCGPLYQRHVSPDRELDAAVVEWSVKRDRLIAKNMGQIQIHGPEDSD